ncbi:hypothetical protein Tco_1013145 [Tanacetum coccineum]
MLAPKGPTFNGRPTFTNLMYLKKAQSEKPCLYEISYDKSDPANRLVPNREETMTLEKESSSKLNKDKVRPYDYTKLNSLYEIFKPATQEYHEQLAHANEEKHSLDHFRAPTAHDMEIEIKTCLMPLALKTLNDSFTFVHELKLEMHDDLITKKPKVVPISIRKPKSQAKKYVATPPKKIVASESTIQNSKSYYRMLYEKTSKAWKWWIEQQCPSGYKWVPKTKMKWVPKIVQIILFIVDSGCTKHMTGNLKLLYLEVVFRKSTCFVRDLKRNDLLTGTSNVNKSSSPIDNSKQQDTPPTMNNPSLTEPTTPTTNLHAEENNDNQAEDTQVQQAKFINPFCIPVREVVESSSSNIDNSNTHTFYQPHDSEYRWTKDHLLEQVRGNPSKPVQTRRQLATDPEMCMFALTVSIAEPKTIKESMANSAWIEEMQEELH